MARSLLPSGNPWVHVGRNPAGADEASPNEHEIILPDRTPGLQAP